MVPLYILVRSNINLVMELGEKLGTHTHLRKEYTPPNKMVHVAPPPAFLQVKAVRTIETIME